MIENQLLKIKAKKYKDEYLSKKESKVLTPGETIQMRKAVSNRLKEDINQLDKMHKSITNQLFKDKSQIHDTISRLI